MKKLNAISSETANLICSSQVIVSLENAIKELIENSIDAGATTIEVKLTGFGVDLVSLIDNASGISLEQQSKFGKRHHTSKISNFDDIENTESFGFRGEAISSLCALCDLEITTCSDPPLGQLLTFDRQGNVKSTAGVARSKGTTVFLKQLFSSLPVRQQEFKKTAKKQYFKSIEMIQAYCLAYPNIRFTVSNTIDGKRTTPIKSTGTGSLMSTLSSIFGASSNANLLEIDLNIPVKDKNDIWYCKCTGLISKPKPLCGRGDTSRQFFYVNNKPIDIPKLSKSVNQIYREFNSNQYPVLVLFLRLPMDRLDRNVTPDKRSLILDNEDGITLGFKEALAAYFDPYRGEFQNIPTITRQHTQTTFDVTPSESSLPSQPVVLEKLRESLPFRPSMSYDHPEIVSLDLKSIAWKSKKVAKDFKNYKFSDGNFTVPIFISKTDFPKMKVIGQFNLGFILVKHDDHLFIVDQHASDEKYLFEKYRNETKILVQPLLMAKKLYFTPQQELILKEHQDALKSKGFVVTQDENEEWYLEGIPHLKNSKFNESDLEEVIVHLSDNPGSIPVCSKLNAIFASKACRTAVMIGDPLDQVKMNSILRNMENLRQPWNCPHGRPTVRVLSKITAAAD